MFRLKRFAVLGLFVVTLASMALAGCSGTDPGSDPNKRQSTETEKQQHKEKAGD